MQCFWQCITKYLTEWNFFSDQFISIQPPSSSLQPPEHKKTLLLSSILFFGDKPLCNMKWIFWQYVVLKHVSLEGKQVSLPTLSMRLRTLSQIIFPLCTFDYCSLPQSHLSSLFPASSASEQSELQPKTSPGSPEVTLPLRQQRETFLC